MFPIFQYNPSVEGQSMAPARPLDKINIVLSLAEPLEQFFYDVTNVSLREDVVDSVEERITSMIPNDLVQMALEALSQVVNCHPSYTDQQVTFQQVAILERYQAIRACLYPEYADKSVFNPQPDPHAQMLINAVEDHVSVVIGTFMEGTAAVGLGNVQNYGVASNADAVTGTATNLCMTPSSTAAAAEPLFSHVSNQSNPHNVTAACSTAPDDRCLWRCLIALVVLIAKAIAFAGQEHRIPPEALIEYHATLNKSFYDGYSYVLTIERERPPISWSGHDSYWKVRPNFL